MLVAILSAALSFSILIWVIVTHNRLVRISERAEEAWSGIEVQLGRRANLIPSLVETVKEHARHERGVLEEVARARGALQAAVGAAAAAEANENVTRSLVRLVAVVESYPQLQASRSFLDLQEELSDAEQKIAFARQFYNRVVAAFNARVRSLPDILVARAFRFEPLEFFGAEEGEVERVSVELG